MSQAVKSQNIINPVADTLLFVLGPLVAFLVAPTWPFSKATFAILTAGHIPLVLMRSHLNASILQRFRLRLTVVPAVLLVLLLMSDWALAIASVLGAFWNLYHIGAQHFGICQIFDSKCGKPTPWARRLDLLLCCSMVVVPFMVSHVLFYSQLPTFAREFGAVGARELASVPALVRPYFFPLSDVALWAGVAVLLSYVIGFGVLRRAGHVASVPKIVFLGTFVAISAGALYWERIEHWLFMSTFLHSMQYYALVYWVEHKNVGKRSGVSHPVQVVAVTMLVMFLLVYGFGYASLKIERTPYASELFRAGHACIVWMTLLHFWFDGFVWSAREVNKQIATQKLAPALAQAEPKAAGQTAV